MIAGHNLLDGVRSANPIWVMLHSPGFVVNHPGSVVFASYTLIPWVGVTAVGYVFGQIYRWSPERRRAFLLRVGLCLTAAFLVLRAINIYGDPSRWAWQSSAALTIVSFLNVTKYPPSLLFLLMAGALALLMRRKIGRLNGREIISAFARIAVASAVMSVVCYFSYYFLHRQFGAQGFLYKAIECFVPIALGGITFIVAAKLLKIREVDRLYNAFARKLGRK